MAWGLLKKAKPFSLIFRGFGSKYFRVLGIETSCDDTAVAILDSERKILGESKYSQSHIHTLHGGILPQFAEALHLENIETAVSEVVERSKVKIEDLDAIAVTVKPGIPSSLTVGINYAKDLCKQYRKPLIPIHHMEAHALTVRLIQKVEFPFLVLLLSGGHCILGLAESVTKFSVLGETLDIAPGLLLDRVSRRLKLRNIKEFALLQGGVAIENAAMRGNPLAVRFLTNLKRQRDCNFSIAAIYQAFKAYVDAEEERLNILGDKLLPNVYDVCASCQYALTKHICERLETAMRYMSYNKIMDCKRNVLVVSGGVAANEFIRKMLKHVCDAYNYILVAPPRNLCTDNGVMIAWNGIERLRENVETVQPADLDLVHCSARCSLGTNLSDDVLKNSWKSNYLNLKSFL